MNVLAELRTRFSTALNTLYPNLQIASRISDSIRPTQNSAFGDYQATLAMSLAKQLQRPSQAIAAEIAATLQVADLFYPPTVAGPGFINLRLLDDLLAAQMHLLFSDKRLGVPPCTTPRKYIIDYSSPNVAKSMHVGHIRSTVIGDALCRVLRFLGHCVISDNHLGDWGTQFGMIIYGYKHFADHDKFSNTPVLELNRLYRLVHKIASYQEATETLRKKKQLLNDKLAVKPPAQTNSTDQNNAYSQPDNNEIECLRHEIELTQLAVKELEGSPTVMSASTEHERIRERVLHETAKLHAGDPENISLWREFMPLCREEIQRIYSRLNVTFDHELGESFYHDRLPSIVGDLIRSGLARESEGAVCVFIPTFDTPFIVRKQDGAYLYATTDLATIEFRVREWFPDAILYVVDHRQAEHFEKLFATARLMGYTSVELHHIAFGAVLGDDGKPYRTRSGDTVGLEGLLDEAVLRVKAVMQSPESRGSLALLQDEVEVIAESVGIAAVKYGDLSHDRSSDYRFTYDTMLSFEGNTAAYMQYCYARCRSILRKAQDRTELAFPVPSAVVIVSAYERSLALSLLRFPEAVTEVAVDFRPHILTGYLFDLAKHFSRFFEACPVINEEDAVIAKSRLILCELVSRVIKQGLDLLGIQVVERM